ncbi:MAG: hypothetical protein R3B84_23650 [Zavarzinella sp.]
MRYQQLPNMAIYGHRGLRHLLTEQMMRCQFKFLPWIPAFAGMTVSSGKQFIVDSLSCPWIPAFAGMTFSSG